MNIFSKLPIIYDSALSGSSWQASLDAVAEAVGCRGVMLYSKSDVDPTYSVQRSNSIYIGREEVIKTYLDRFKSVDAQGVEMSQKTEFLKPLFDTDIWPDLHTAPERKDVLFIRREMGLDRRIIYNLSNDDFHVSGLILQFGLEMNEIPQENIEYANLILPHVAKTLSIRNLFYSLQQKYKAVLGALDNMAVGIAAIGADGHIFVKNRHFQAILSEQDGIRIDKFGKIAFHDEDIRMQYKGHIEAIAGTVSGRNGPREFSLSIPRRSGAESYLLEISPIRDFDDELNANFSGCLVCLIDPLSPPPISIKPFAAYFGLTLAESEIAEGLLSGVTFSQLAEKRSVAIDTVKSQCKAIYGKARVNSRVGLIRKMVNLSPPILHSN